MPIECPACGARDYHRYFDEETEARKLTALLRELTEAIEVFWKDHDRPEYCGLVMKAVAKAKEALS